MTKPLREGQVHAVVVRPAFQQLKVHGAPLREGPPADVTERIVGAGRRVVPQIDLLRAFFAPASSEGVIDFHGHVQPQLVLNAGRGLVAVRSLASGIVDFLSERTIHTAGDVVDITRALQRLLKARLGTVEPTPIPVSESRKVRAPVIENLVFKTVQIALGLLDSVIGSESIEQAISTAYNGSVV